MTPQQIATLFAYHEGDDSQVRSCVAIRSALFRAAQVITENTPEGPDQTAAIRKLREACQTAIAAVVVPKWW